MLTFAYCMVASVLFVLLTVIDMFLYHNSWFTAVKEASQFEYGLGLTFVFLVLACGLIFSFILDVRRRSKQ